MVARDEDVASQEGDDAHMPGEDAAETSHRPVTLGAAWDLSVIRHVVANEADPALLERLPDWARTDPRNRDDAL